VGERGVGEIVGLLEANRAIRRLSLEENPLGDAGALAIARARPALTVLNLAKTGIKNEATAVELLGIESLTELELSRNDAFQVGELFAKALGGSKALRSLNLHTVGLNMACARVIARALENSSLTALYLGANRIGDDGARALTGVLSSTTLERLYLSNSEIGPAGAALLARSLRSHATLRKLVLMRNKIGAGGAEALAEALRSNKVLEELDLSDCQIADVSPLAGALAGNTALTSLDLSANEFGDAGAKALAEAIRANRSLTRLVALRCQVGRAGARALFSALKTNPSVTELAVFDEREREMARDMDAALKVNFESRGLTLVRVCIDGVGADSAALAAVLAQPSLTLVSACDNPLITHLPSSPPSTLAFLDISRCSLSVIPAAFASVPEVLYAGNDIHSPPAEVCAMGWAEVKLYFAEFLASGGQRNGQVKLFLTGLGEAGKTTLLKALMAADDRAPVKIGKDDRTFGVDVTEWEVSGTRDPMKLVVSDFAGQKVYYLTHQFFMTARGVYMLIMRPFRSERAGEVVKKAPDAACEVCKKGFDNSDDARVYHLEGRGLVHAGCFDYSEMVGDWLRRIYFRAPGARVVPVLTRCDDGVADLPEQLGRIQAEIDRTLALLTEDVAAALAAAASAGDPDDHARLQRLRALRLAPLVVSPVTVVDSLTGTGVSALRSRIVEAVEALFAYGEVVPASFQRLALEVVALRAQRSERGVSIPWSEYEALCARVGLDRDIKVRLATKFLHATGVLLHFDTLGNLVGNMVFLDPSAVADMMKAIVSHDHLGAAPVSAALRIHLTALVRRGVLDHDILLPHLFRAHRILPEADLADPAKVYALAEVLREFGIMFKDRPFFAQTGKERSVVPCMATRPAVVAASAALPSPPALERTSFKAVLSYSMLPEGFVFRLIAMHVQPRQTVVFSPTSADFVLHGRRTTVVVHELADSQSVTVTVVAPRARDMKMAMTALTRTEAFFLVYAGATAAGIVLILGGKQGGGAVRNVQTFLSSPFKATDRWWELTFLARRVLLAMVNTMAPLNSAWQPVGVSTVLIASLGVHSWRRPFARDLDNAWEATSLGLLTTTYVFGLVAGTPRFALGAGAISWALVVLNAIFLIACAGAFLSAALGKRLSRWLNAISTQIEAKKNKSKKATSEAI
jgi:Ran GTPase-activating protein (RanGAP) involved in mRNA processing and transport